MNPVTGTTGDYRSLASLGITTGADGHACAGCRQVPEGPGRRSAVGKQDLFVRPVAWRVKLGAFVDSKLSATGEFASRNASLAASRKNLDKDKDALEARMVVIQQRYMKQFTALDSMLGAAAEHLQLPHAAAAGPVEPRQLRHFGQVAVRARCARLKFRRREPLSCMQDRRFYMSAYPTKSSLAAYRSVAAHSGVAAADPHRLIVMLMDGALERIGSARGAMDHGQRRFEQSPDPRRRGDRAGTARQPEHGGRRPDRGEPRRPVRLRQPPAGARQCRQSNPRCSTKSATLLRQIRSAWIQIPAQQAANP